MREAVCCFKTVLWQAFFSFFFQNASVFVVTPFNFKIKKCSVWLVSQHFVNCDKYLEKVCCCQTKCLLISLTCRLPPAFSLCSFLLLPLLLASLSFCRTRRISRGGQRTNRRIGCLYYLIRNSNRHSTCGHRQA